MMTKTFANKAVAAVLSATIIASPMPALAFLGGGMPSDIATDGTLESVGDSLSALLRAIRETQFEQTGQLSGNLKEQISSEANMRQLMDERARQREIERQKFEALKNSAVSHQECVIRTRVAESDVFNRPEERLSQQTLNTLEQLASWNLGTPVGGSGAPRRYDSMEQKAEMELKDQANKFCDPALASQGYCAAPVAPNLQGMNYDAGKSMFSGINYSSDQVFEGCRALMKNTAGLGGEGIVNTSSKATVDSAVQQRAIFTSQSRMSIAQKVMLDYCHNRNPNSNKMDASQERVIETATKMAGYEESDFPNGMSYAMGMQIRSQEWLSKDYDAADQDYTEVGILKDVAMTLGWMAHQNNELYKKVDQMGVLQAATLAAINEGVSLQRDQLEDNDTIVDAINSN
ncbi:hypothetical protein [Salipiger mucosus]|nr:hypothetical protein [Salipiger mucosus]